MGCENLYSTKEIVGNSVDSLVLEGINHIHQNGEPINARAGSGLQAYNVNYVLTNPLDRVHSLRAPTSVQYLSRELLAYFNGSLSAEDMAKASKFWLTIKDGDGKINSNYGYYVFHYTVPNALSQYEWVTRLLNDKPRTRRGIININQPYHKTDTKDMPCTIAMQFFVQKDHLCSVISTRSTDVITGLPYDQGFFSFVLELMQVDLVERGNTGLKLGYCAMKSTFTQLYDSRTNLENEIISKNLDSTQKIVMPKINHAKPVLDDIINGTAYSDIIQWCQTNS